MRIRRLGWAGLEIEAEGRSAVIDLLEGFGPMAPVLGDPLTALPRADARGEVSLALLTHLHSDHADPAALGRALAPDAEVLRPAPGDGAGVEIADLDFAERGLAELAHGSRVVEPWESVEAGPFRVTAVPAVDGLGHPQVSWVLEAGGRRILHCGDTMFHGSWWQIGHRLGPFDAAFLPVNGAVIDLPHRQPANTLAAVMDPRQAAEAAAIVGARVAVPIHYGAIHKPPIYVQLDRPADAFAAAAAERGVEAKVVAPGDPVELTPPRLAPAQARERAPDPRAGLAARHRSR